MIYSAGNNASGYPFIRGCSRELSVGFVLREGSILDVNLYPPCGAIDYAQILRIGRNYQNRSMGEINIGDPSGNLICVVNFENLYTDDAMITGTAIYQNSVVCGSMVCSRDILPILRSDYHPDNGSFIFTPSVFRPRPQELSAGYGRLRETEGGVITSVTFSNPDTDARRQFKTDENGEVTLKQESATNVGVADTPVQKIKLNGTSAPDTRHLRIMPTKDSPIRLDVKGEEIVVGVGCEL